MCIRDSSTPLNNIASSQAGLIYNFSKRARVYGIVGNLKDTVRNDAASASLGAMNQTLVGINLSF